MILGIPSWEQLLRCYNNFVVITLLIPGSPVCCSIFHNSKANYLWVLQIEFDLFGYLKEFDTPN